MHLPSLGRDAHHCVETLVINTNITVFPWGITVYFLELLQRMSLALFG